MNIDLISLLNEHKESETIDYKEKIDFVKNKFDLIKDIIAFSNTSIEGPKYIVYGVRQEKENFKNIGLKDSHYGDESVYQSLISEKIEPYVPIAFHKVKLQDNNFLILEIKPDIKNRPYMVKNDYSQNGKKVLFAGDSFIRKGTHKKRMLRNDYDEIYRHNQKKLEIDLQHYELFIIDQNPATLDLIIRNYSEVTKLYTEVYLEILDANGKHITVCKMHGIKIDGLVRKGSMESDFTLSIPSKSEIYGLGMFSFTSTQAIMVGLNEYGEGKTYTFKLHLRSSKEEKIFTYSNCSIYGRGAVLWKIQLNTKEDKNRKRKSRKN